ncbi:MAG TPA: hypothetical protein VFV87_22070, partial [Pirellulaceae bacterium]|nr:hypothetical protein [Pirellulaceae bacterium]
MPTISLTTFMKLCSKTPSSKATAYSKYLTPGGYDFYQRLKVEANAATVLGKSHSDCEEALASIANESERKHNLAGFKALVKWLITESGKFFAPPTALCESPKGFIKVRLKPEFGIETAVGRRLVTLWNTKKPELTSSIAGVGIYLMNQHLLKGDFEDCKSAVL